MSQIDPTGTAALLADTVTRALADVVTPAGTLQAEAQGVDPAAWRSHCPSTPWGKPVWR